MATNDDESRGSGSGGGRHHQKKEPVVIPKHKLTNGELVALQGYNTIFDDNDNAFFEGIIVAHNKTSITVCINRDRDSRSPKITGLCKM